MYFEIGSTERWGTRMSWVTSDELIDLTTIILNSAVVFWNTYGTESDKPSTSYNIPVDETQIINLDNT